MKFRKVLSIETSCDDTSVALVGHEGTVFKSLVLNQNNVHKIFAGVVPEIASRNHSSHLVPLIDEILKETQTSWSDIDGIVVTARPGLLGSLMVGVVTAKTLAMVLKKPLIGVNHLEGHIFAPFLRDESYVPGFDHGEPFIALTVSGGHTSLYLVRGLGEYHLLGETLDDAAGEAFDKFSKMVGLGYPGGVLVDSASKAGNPKGFSFPRSMSGENEMRMSFSGLKSAGLRLITELGEEQVEARLSDLCASYQEAIVDVLMDRLDKAMRRTGIRRAVVTGGVSANSRLRARADEWAKNNRFNLLVPPLRYCSDNAAMIGYAGIMRLNNGEHSEQSLGPEARAPLYEERLRWQ